MNCCKHLLPLLFLAVFSIAKAQDLPLSYTLGENNSDRYKYSTVLSINNDEKEQTILVRTYYGGMPLRPKGHFIEVYDTKMNLIEDYNYRYAGPNMVEGFVRNGQIYLLELKYNMDSFAYEYIVHQSPIHEFNFTERSILSIPSKEVLNPLAVNKYNRKFGNGFSTATHFNDDQSAFAITVHHREGKKEKYHMYLYGTDLRKHLSYDFTSEIEEKNYAFENIEVSKDMKTVYFMGKAFFKKKRFGATERRYQYELVRVTENGHTAQEFADAGRYPEALKPGLVHYKLDTKSLAVRSSKYNAFSDQFMIDKFGREVDTEIKNLIFKDVHITPNNDIIFSAEEYFITKGKDIGDGNTREFNKYHYNDIVCARLNSNGEMLWARNINKTEVTKGDEAYASYTAYGDDNDMYFFINSGEHPQEISKNRIMFRQGYSKNPNMFVIRLDGAGNLKYQKLIDDKETRLPIMVSRPLIHKEDNYLLFYAKRGSKKQMIKVQLNTSSDTERSK